MALNRTYCTTAEVVADIFPVQTSPITDARIMKFIRSASEYIDKKIGNFIPTTETRSLDGNGFRELLLDKPLTMITTVINHGVTLASSDYLLYPRNKMWEDGPYSKIIIDPDSAASPWYNEADSVSILGRWGLYEKLELLGETVQNNPLTISGTSLTTVGDLILSIGMVLLIETEQCMVTAHPSTNTWTIVRAVNGTTAAAHVQGTAINRYIPPEDLNQLCRQIAILSMRKAETGYVGKAGSSETGETFYYSEYPKSVIDEIKKNYRFFRL